MTDTRPQGSRQEVLQGHTSLLAPPAHGDKPSAGLLPCPDSDLAESPGVANSCFLPQVASDKEPQQKQIPRIQMELPG